VLTPEKSLLFFAKLTVKTNFLHALPSYYFKYRLKEKKAKAFFLKECYYFIVTSVTGRLATGG
jgi:hypothetical protein